MSSVSILVTEARPITLPPVYSYQEAKQNTGFTKRIRGKKLFESVILKPGKNVNCIEREHWDKIKDKCEIYIRARIMYEIEEGANVPEKFDPDAQIKYQTVEHALVAIKEEVSTSRMEAWFKHEEERPEVQEAIKARLVEMVSNNQKATK